MFNLPRVYIVFLYGYMSNCIISVHIRSRDVGVTPSFYFDVSQSAVHVSLTCKFKSKKAMCVNSER